MNSAALKQCIDNRNNKIVVSNFNAAGWAEDMKGKATKTVGIYDDDNGNVIRKTLISLEDGDFVIEEVLKTVEVRISDAVCTRVDCPLREIPQTRGRHLSAKEWLKIDWSKSDEELAMELGKKLSTVKRARSGYNPKYRYDANRKRIAAA